MEHWFGDDEREVGETVRRFAAETLAPRAAEVDERSLWVGEHVEALAGMGLMGMNLPERWGGAGVSARALMLAVEAVAAACGSTASMLTAHFLATDAILLGGDDDLRGRYLPGAADGSLLGAFALTEPAAGSNPADMRTRALPERTGWRLTGSKCFISNGGEADFVVVFAVTDPPAGHRGISAFVVDRDTPGLSAGAPERTMGLKGGHVFELSLDCHVPAANRLGEAGSGFRTAMRTLDNGRIEVAAMCNGIAGAALEAAVAWARERRVGDGTVADFQGVQWMLADMAVRLDAARLLAFRAADLRARGRRHSQESAMAKLHASETAAFVTDAALQVHGGYGYTRGLPLERWCREVRIMRIYEGSSEIQRNIVARGLLR